MDSLIHERVVVPRFSHRELKGNGSESEEKKKENENGGGGD